MINILGDENDMPFEDEDKKHGEGYDPNTTRGKLVRLKPEREEKIKAEFDCVVVNEFGDEYHLSEEERIAKNKFYEAFKVFSKCKHKYRKLDEYVEAMREALKCLDFVAENNGVYEPEKFKKLFFKDEIYINGLSFPQFKGRERKSISWDYLTEFILSDKPASEIIPNGEDILSDDDLEDLKERLFTEEELEEILAEPSEEEIQRQNTFFDVDCMDPSDKNVVIILNDKQCKKITKNQPEFLYMMKEIKRSQSRLDNLARSASSFVYDLTSEDIEAIQEYDNARGYYSDSDVPEFHGDLINSSDYAKYMQELDDWERTHIKYNYNGKLKTQEEIDSIELKQFLEQHGWNIRNLYGNKEKEEKLRRIQKRDKKREKEIRAQLIKVQERRKRHMGEDIESSEKSGKKKKGKKKKNKKSEDSV